MVVEAVVFDFGQVMIDWNPRYLYRTVFKDEAEMEYFLENVCSFEWNWNLDKGKPFDQSIKELQEKFPKYTDEIALWDTRWSEMQGEISQPMFDVLKDVAKRYPVYGLTNWPGEKFDPEKPKHSFFHIFDGIVVSGFEKQAKPEEPLFHILIERYNLNPETTVFIDDNNENIKTADKIGFQTILFKNADQVKEILKSKGVI